LTDSRRRLHQYSVFVEFSMPPRFLLTGATDQMLAETATIAAAMRAGAAITHATHLFKG
jgi:alkylhydroperoxidase/carboxymuconolactone decarboxylase family protein YurZ